MIKDIPIIYEDQNVLVINKPAGLSVHGDGVNKEETLADWLVAKYPEMSNVGESMFNQKGMEIKKPGLVHRLDKDTSGVMIVAKNQDSFLFLKKQFQDRETKKVYRAILSGVMKMEVGEEKTINLPIGRSASHTRKRVAGPRLKGVSRDAVTVFHLLDNICNKYSYVEVKPKTGRTHQIRVHFKAYNNPIIGDSLYYPEDQSGVIARQALHAYSLTLNLPDGEPRTFTAPLPADFETALEKLKTSC